MEQESYWNEKERNNLLPGLQHGEKYTKKRLVVNPPWTYKAMKEALERILEENPAIAIMVYPTTIK